MGRVVVEHRTGRFVPLPDRFHREDEELSDRLLNAIHGRGAFRYFRVTVHDAGVADDWWEYRSEAYREVAREWCIGNRIR